MTQLKTPLFGREKKNHKIISKFSADSEEKLGD